MAHDHKKGHNHTHANNVHGKKLLGVTVINLGIMVMEIIGGLISNSLALLSDSVHKLGDVLALGIAYLANRYGNRKADFRKTFGYKRIEILAAFFNALLLIGICLFLLFEAYERFIHPEEIRGMLMLIVASVGLVADWVCILILRDNRKESINVKSAYLHLLGDTLSSVAVIAGGLAIILWGVEWVDPVVTVVVALYVMYHTWGVLKESIDILMQAAPADMDFEEIRKTLEALPEVDNIHHLHIWRLTDSKLYFECHVDVKENIDVVRQTVLRQKIDEILRAQFGIDHTTLQFGYRCCPDKKELIVPENK